MSRSLTPEDRVTTRPDVVEERLDVSNSQDLWIGVSRGLLVVSRLILVAGSFDELAVSEGGSGADQGDQVRGVDRSPLVLG